jgi:SAM-dependent methyltransferase
VGADLPAAVRAFDAAADGFDQRFGQLLSVAAQRRTVREYLLRIFPPGARLLELGAGTGEDAVRLLEHGYRVLLTDGSPSMIAQAAAKIRRASFEDRAEVEQLVLERLDSFAERRRHRGSAPFDGVYSNFAAFNCVADPAALAAPLAALLRPGAAFIPVVFGPWCPGEVLVQLLRGDPRAAVRRLRRSPVPASIGGRAFPVWYRSPAAWARALVPYFRLRRVRGVGILVPPSGAEPWISRYPRLVRALEALDRVLTTPLARLGDHLLLHFERTAHAAP